LGVVACPDGLVVGAFGATAGTGTGCGGFPTGACPTGAVVLAAATAANDADGSGRGEGALGTVYVAIFWLASETAGSRSVAFEIDVVSASLGGMEDTVEAEGLVDPGVVGGGGGMAFKSAAAAAAISAVGGLILASCREQLPGRVKALSLDEDEEPPESAVGFVGSEF